MEKGNDDRRHLGRRRGGKREGSPRRKSRHQGPKGGPGCSSSGIEDLKGRKRSQRSASGRSLVVHDERKNLPESGRKEKQSKSRVLICSTRKKDVMVSRKKKGQKRPLKKTYAVGDEGDPALCVGRWNKGKNDNAKRKNSSRVMPIGDHDSPR